MGTPDFYSQFGEDRWITENLILPRNGFFVDIGAYDGIASSNTLHFEKLGWDGFCVEAVPELALESAQNRECPLFCCAAAGTDSLDAFFYIHENDRGRSGLTSIGRAIKTRKRTLRELMKHFNRREIDLLSIDTEGTELDVWRGAWPYRPSVVVIEYLTWGSPPRDKEIVESMLESGYWEVHRTEANLIMICHSCLEKNLKGG